MTTSCTLDLESYDPNDTSGLPSIFYTVNQPDPRYAGLNRAQRRKAMAVEARAARKEKGRQRG